MKRSVLALLLLLMGLLVRAQDTTRMSLPECIKVALENNLRVKRGYYNVQSSEVNVLQNKAAFLPTLNFGGSYGRNFGRAINPVTNLYANNNFTTINIQATSQWTLFNALRLQNTYRQSIKDLQASNFDLNKAKNDVIVNVVTLYTTVIFNRELYDNAKFQLNTSEQQLTRIKKQVDAGSLPLSNQLNQEATVATNEVNLINQENALNLSLLQLKQAMQISGSTLIDVVIPQIEMEDLVLDQTPEEIYKIAQGTMPEIKSAMLKIESAQLALKASRGSYYPRLLLNGSAQSNYSSISDGPRYNQTTIVKPIGTVVGTGQVVEGAVPSAVQYASEYNEKTQLNDNLFRSLSLTLQIPIFNGLQTRAGVQRAIISEKVASVAALETENTLRQTIETAYNDAVSASKTYTASLKQVNARQEAWRMTKQRFENGAATYVEYTISENDLFSAKSDLARSKYNFIFKKKLLDFYLGKTIEY